MFKSLKQKIGTTESHNNSKQSKNKLDTRKRSTSNISRSGSISSLNLSENDLTVESLSNKEDLHSALLKTTAKLKRNEVKLADYSRELKERTRECEKLTVALEKHQDSSLRKINELNDDYTNQKEKHDKIVTELEGKEKKLNEDVEKLTFENKKLTDEVAVFQSEKEEFESRRREFYLKRDSEEEVIDLQRQEIAKLKHMLMNSEKKISKLQDDYTATSNSLSEVQSTFNHGKNQFEIVQKKLDHTLENNSLLQKENEKLQGEGKQQQAIIKKLSGDNVDLKDRNGKLSAQLQQTKSKVNSAENDSIYYKNKYENLKHSNNSLANKASSGLNEKQATIEHLQDKLKVLEITKSTSELPGDQQLQAVIQQRNELKLKFEESSQQLLSIKSDWSDKITKLETQKAHLNSKISEDTFEHEEKCKNYESKIHSLTMQVDHLTEDLEKSKNTLEDLTTNNEDYLQQIADLEASKIEQKTLHEMQLNQNEQSYRQANQDYKIKEQEFINKLNAVNQELTLTKADIQKTQSVSNEELIEKSKLITKLKEQISNYVTEISKMKETENAAEVKIENLNINLKGCNATNATLKKATVESENKIKLLDSKIKSFEAKLSSSTKEISKLENEKLKFKTEIETHRECIENSFCKVFENDKTNTKLNSLNEIVQLMMKKFEELQTTIEKRNDELLSSKEEIASLKNNQSNGCNEIKVLACERQILEDKLQEKERSLKLMTQRVNDLKKTLSREIQNNKQKKVEAPVVPSTHPKQPIMPSEEIFDDSCSLLSPGLSDHRRDVLVEYLKNVLIEFVSSSQQEALHLIKAMSKLLSFTTEQERIVRENLRNKSSWFKTSTSRKLSKNKNIKTKH